MARIVIESSELTLLDDAGRLRLAELVAASGLSETEVIALVELGAFEACGIADEEPLFAARSLAVARAVARLRADFDLTVPAMALAAAYLERIAELEARVRRLECLLPPGGGE